MNHREYRRLGLPLTTFNEQSCKVDGQADQSAGEGDGGILGEGDERGCFATASGLPERLGPDEIILAALPIPPNTGERLPHAQ